MIRAHLDAMDTNKNIPMVELPTAPIVRNKALRTNHACTLCGLYGHYSHHCQDLPKFRMALADLRHHFLEYEITLIEEVHPPPPSSHTMSIYMMSSSIALLSPPSPTVHQTCLFHCFPNHNRNLSYQGNSGVHSRSTFSFSFSFSLSFSYHPRS